MAGQKCKCGHEKRDHRVASAASRGACSICLCDSYQTSTPRPKPVVERAIEDSTPANVRNSWMIR